MTSSNQPYEKLLDAVVKRAAFDGQFRKKLLASPADALQEAFGVRIPDGFRVRFVEKDPDLDALVVLPDLKQAEEELSDDDLDAVAGGFMGDTDW